MDYILGYKWLLLVGAPNSLPLSMPLPWKFALSAKFPENDLVTTTENKA